ncbi:hypothetical protein JCM10207_006364 [Rhodosporidiobolus poonsookiae]
MLASSTSTARTALRTALAAPPATRAYAAKAQAAGSRKKAAQALTRGQRPGEGQGDARIEAIKTTLYETDPSDADRLAALAKVVPSTEVHETITRAWALHLRHRRESHAAELGRKYAHMRRAIDLLEETDQGLWKQATEGRKFQNVDQSRTTNARLEGLVPREMRVPTEQPGAQLWDSAWKAPQEVKP